MPNNLLIKLKDLSKDDVPLVGGKAASLGELTQAGVNVPPGFVVTTEVYRTHGHGDLPKDLQAEIMQAFDQLGAERVSVRSSAVAEDSSSGSWAGQFESYLNVTRSELIESIYKCWESVDNATAYAEQQKASKEDLLIGVIVQQMIDSEVSGVAFSINPVSHNTGEIMVEAVYGLGELLVQGMVTPDNYVLNKSSAGIISQNIPPKPSMMAFTEGTTKEIPVSPEKADKPCLNNQQINDLVKAITHIENHYKSPQDIEWAIANNQLYILQSRPITTS